MSWRAYAVAMLSLALAACMSAPPWARAPLPSQVRPDDSFVTRDLDWHDAGRERAVPARLYLPHSARQRPAPLLVFSHGMGGSREGYSYIARDLAAHGIASLHVQHIGSDRSVWLGNRLTTVLRLLQAAHEDEAIARVHDVRFALDTLLGTPEAQQIDPQRIAVAGHSYGATTAMLLGGARVVREGEVLPFVDARFKAAVLISAPPFYGEDDFHPILQSLRLPTLHVTSTEDVITIPGYRSEAADRIKVFDATGSPHKLLAVFKGGSHSMFTDRLNTGGDINPQVKHATRELVRLFLLDQFAPAPQALPRQLGHWRSQHDAIIERLQHTSPSPQNASLHGRAP